MGHPARVNLAAESRIYPMPPAADIPQEGRLSRLATKARIIAMRQGRKMRAERAAGAVCAAARRCPPAILPPDAAPLLR